MKFLGILRASGLCLLAIGFHSQFVSCGIFKGPKKPKEDSNVKAAEFSENPEDSNVKSKAVEKSSQEPSSASSAPVAKSNLVFENSKWDDSMLASSVLFLEEFCRQVNANRFSGRLGNKIFKNISTACIDVSYNLIPFTLRFMPAYGPGTVTGRKSIQGELYKGALKPEELEIYVEWLKKNIPEVRKSYINMNNAALKLPKGKLKNDASVGPLKYGFVYKDDLWGGTIYRVSSTNYSDPNFIESLDDLQKSLNNIITCGNARRSS